MELHDLIKKLPHDVLMHNMDKGFICYISGGRTIISSSPKKAVTRMLKFIDENPETYNQKYPSAEKGEILAEDARKKRTKNIVKNVLSVVSIHDHVIARMAADEMSFLSEEDKNEIKEEGGYQMARRLEAYFEKGGRRRV